MTTALRSAIQLALFIMLLGGGAAAFGWWGLLVGFAAWIAIMVIVTVIQMKRQNFTIGEPAETDNDGSETGAESNAATVAPAANSTETLSPSERARRMRPAGDRRKRAK